MGIFTKDIKSMDDLLIHGLQDIYYAEQQIIKSLPKMIDKATNRDLVADRPSTKSSRRPTRLLAGSRTEPSSPPLRPSSTMRSGATERWGGVGLGKVTKPILLLKSGGGL